MYHWVEPGKVARCRDPRARKPAVTQQLKPAPVGRGKVKMQDAIFIAPADALP